MINIRKRNNLYEYRFEVGKVNGKRKQISKSGFKTKRDAYIAGQRAYEEFINGENTKECNMLYSEYLDYWMREYFEINYKYSTAKRYKESFGEVFALTWNDIDLDNRIIKVNKTVYAKDKEENGRWYLGAAKTIGSHREVYICDTLYSFLLKYKVLQNNYKKEFDKNYKYYTLEEVENKYGKLVEYKIIKDNSKRNRVEMVFTRKDGTYSGTDIIRYPFRIIHHELGIQCRFYDLRGNFATICLRNGCEIKDIAETLGHKRIETTQKYYILSLKENKKKVTKVFEESISLNDV